jgi:tetratricopeptide (TPR) repeat protein
VVAEKNKQYKLVEEAFYKIMHVSPNWKPAIAGYWFGKSMLYLGSNEVLAGEYLHALENAIELNDDSGSRQLQLGAELYRMKEYALAQQCLMNAKRLEPRSRWAYYYLGLVYFRTHKYLEAIDEFNATLEIDPEFGNAYFYAAQSFHKLEKFEIAIEYLQEALRLSPNNPSYQEKMKEINLIVLEKSQ